ncbi:glycosyl transferase [Oceaniferula spumae]|uniref:Glycosyl transferase n=1 Tax=Oceaniferula spumae TaxID=2979115 RepID=A0AAT9FNT7_9BACT
MFSILILTKDEEINIQDCLDSVSWCDDVVVLDSFSGDATCDIAKQNGARIYERKFDDFGAQRNYALDEINFKHPWVFHLDADERFNEELRSDCEKVIKENKHSAYFVPNRIIFLGKWIKHCTQYPYPQVRLLKLGEVRFAKSGHGQREDQAKRGVGYIDTPYDHYNFSKGICDWIDKHNRYSSEESLAVMGEVSMSQCFSSDPISRKRALKACFSRMPCRPWLKFIHLYFIRLGFLDGYPGWVYCRLQMMYETMISIKRVENRMNSTEH